MTPRWLAALALIAACAPVVDPRSPFDEDDPRALSEDRPPPTPADPPTRATADEDAAPPGPIAIPGTGARTGTIERATLRLVLDAGPATFLQWFEIEPVTSGGVFVGWRLVQVLPGGRSLTALDLLPGDVLVAVNGRKMVKPDDLGELWLDLYAAPAITVDLRRGDETVTIRFTISGAPLTPPSSSSSAAVTR